MEVGSDLSLDQVKVLVSIVESGGFTAAARKLGRTQGSISYHVRRLERQLDLTLFDRSAHRPVLTEAGEAVLQRSREVLEALDNLRRTAGALQEGVEAVVALAIDILFPPEQIAALLKAFEAKFPSVQLSLRGGVYDEPLAQLRAGHAHIAIAPTSLADETVLARFSTSVAFVPVVAPTHPLASALSPVSGEMLNRHRRLVLMTNTPIGIAQETRSNVWRLSDCAMRRGLLLRGVGWSNVPRFEVDEDLRTGRLVELRLEHNASVRSVDLSVMIDKSRPTGQAARWIFDHLDRRPRPESRCQHEQ